MLQLLITAVLSSAVIAPLVTSQTAQAQRRGSLRQYPLLENSTYTYTTSTNIDSQGGFGLPFAEGDLEVIAGRQLFNSPFRMRAHVGGYTVLSTSIDVDDFDGLRVKIVTPDYATAREHKTRLILWQGGDDKAIYDNVQPGTVIDYDFALDYSESDNPGSISFEIQCDDSQGYYCSAYFVEAELSPTGEFIPPE